MKRSFSRRDFLKKASLVTTQASLFYIASTWSPKDAGYTRAGAKTWQAPSTEDAWACDTCPGTTDPAGQACTTPPNTCIYNEPGLPTSCNFAYKIYTCL